MPARADNFCLVSTAKVAAKVPADIFLAKGAFPSPEGLSLISIGHFEPILFFLMGMMGCYCGCVKRPKVFPLHLTMPVYHQPSLMRPFLLHQKISESTTLSATTVTHTEVVSYFLRVPIKCSGQLTGLVNILTGLFLCGA